MPRKAVGKQPPQQGPVWEAFVRYWRHAIDDSGRRATAWRAFHAGYCAAAGNDVEACKSLGRSAEPAVTARAEAARPRGRADPMV